MGTKLLDNKNQETILMDLLRVISHHGARLATPIRTVQNIYNDVDLEGIHFADSVSTRGQPARKRPLLLLEPKYKVNGEDKSKGQTQSATKPEVKASDSKVKEKPVSNINDTEKITANVEEDIKPNPDTKDEQKAVPPKVGPKSTSLKPVSQKDSKPIEASIIDDKASVWDDFPEHVIIDKQQKSDADKLPSTVGAAKQENEENPPPSPQPQISRPPLEENIVLGVALEGSKRTLPIEEGMNPSAPSSSDAKELTTAGGRNGGSTTVEKEKKDGQGSNVAGSSSSTDQQKGS